MHGKVGVVSFCQKLSFLLISLNSRLQLCCKESNFKLRARVCVCVSMARCQYTIETVHDVRLTFLARLITAVSLIMCCVQYTW